MKTLAAAVMTAALALASGCEAVPSLTFETPDASEAPDDAEAGCPNCSGAYCNATNCATCASCKAPNVCCARNATNATCGPVCPSH